MRELSLVIPVMDEEDNIKPLLEAVRTALKDFDYEVILVDDGSTDGTRKRIIENADDRTVLVELRKNYGQSTAMTAGIDHASGHRAPFGGHVLRRRADQYRKTACPRARGGEHA